MQSRKFSNGFSLLRLAAVGLLGFGATDASADGGALTTTSALTSQQSQAPLYGGREMASAEYASPERAQAAIGHYSRARALLVQAMREFDEGRQMARPDLVINPDVWTATLNTRAEELNHIISPEARESAGGVRLTENEALLRQNFDKKVATATQAPKPAAKRSARKPAKAVTEQLVAVEKDEAEVSRAKLSDRQPVAERRSESETRASNESDSTAKSASSDLQRDSEAPALKDPELENAVDAEIAKTMGQNSAVKSAAAKSDSSDSKKDDSTKYADEDTSVAKSLGDDEIRERLKKLSEEISQEEKGSN